jgi:hypothetical protein
VDTDQDGRLDGAQLERFVAALRPDRPPPDPASHAAMMEEIGAPGGLVTLAMFVDWQQAQEAGQPEVGLYPNVTSQYSSATPYKISLQAQSLLSESDDRMHP